MLIDSVKQVKSYLFNFSLSVLVSDCIIDPSDTIFRLKVWLLGISIILGLLTVRLKKEVVLFSLFIWFVFPFFYFILGLINFQYYSLDIAFSQWKPYLLFLLLPFITNSFLNNYSQLTFLLIFFTFAILYCVINFDIFILEPFIGDYENTLKIAHREFGSFEVLMIYHNSVSILLFGLGLSLYYSGKSIKYLFLAILSLIVLFFSSTRANWIATILLCLFHIYQRYLMNNFKLRIISILIFGISLLFLVPLAIFTFFSNEDVSLSDKLSFINDYYSLWSNNFTNLFFGQGFGNGIRTGLRGISYNLEVTYLEIIRIYGIIGFLLFLLFLFYPIYVYLKYKSLKNLSGLHKYLYFTYFVYIVIVLPSNPLLFSSNGFVLLLMYYSEVFFLKKMSYV
jgi:hypothetical protein